MPEDWDSPGSVVVRVRRRFEPPAAGLKIAAMKTVCREIEDCRAWRKILTDRGYVIP